MPVRQHGGMAWEWWGPTCTAAVGVVGIVAATYQGSRQSRTTVQVAKQQVDGQVQIAQEERRQRRIETAYEKLQAVLIELDDYTEAVIGETMEGNPPDDADAPDAFTHRLAGGGTLALYWSPRVRQLVDHAQHEIRELNKALLLYHIYANEDGHSDQDIQRELDDLWPRAQLAREAIEAVRDQMSAELNPGAPGRKDEPTSD
jgi:hypothetical protein